MERNKADVRLVSAVERDSGKDEAVVFIFIIATVSLLGWALIRPWVRRWMAVRLSLVYPLLFS